MQRWIGAVLGTFLGAASASAQVTPDPGQAPRVQRAQIDGQLVLRRALLNSGLTVPGVTELLNPDGAGVLVQTRRSLSATEQARLGLSPSGVDPQVHTGWASWSAITALASHPLVIRIEPTRRFLEARPLETIGRSQGSLRTHLRPADGLTGHDVIVAAIDQPVDVLHPHFFHADGGVFEWLDANNNGRFEAGDAVLFDDATVGRLVVLDGFFFDPVSNPNDWQNFDDTLNPRQDWLFADLNGDGIRNAGARDGFDDSSPSLGEPMFVAHDANDNGQLDLDEKLFGLGTSKVLRMWVDERTFHRGQNLAMAADVPLQTDASHGTGVASILLGGQPGFHDRVGLAPGADYIGYANVDEGRQGLVFADAAEHDAMLMLHEWSQPVGVAGDGGSIFEGSMDAARERGMLQVCPLGNLNTAGKQVELTVDGASRLSFRVTDGFFNGQETVPFGYVQAHLAWRSAQDPSIALVRPDGVSTDLDFSGEPRPLGENSFIAATMERTARGTGLANLILFRGDGYSESLALGEWAIVVDGLPVGTVLHGRITDAWSGWSEGVNWDRPTLDRTSLTYPSTADSAIGVAAFGGRLDMRDFGESNVGELRRYSGRGPRIDGAQVVDIAAPDDPLAALATTPALDFPRGHSTAFTPFGGTSGAGPHVAATLALLRDQHPEWDADTLEARLFDSTETAALMPALGALPNPGWGHGKLSLHQALYDTPPPLDNAGPSITAVQGEWTPAGYRVWVEATDPEDDALYYRWDLDYDDAWADAWSQQADRPLPDVQAGDTIALRVAVRDGWGGAAERIAALEVPMQPAPEPEAPEPEAPEPEGPEPEGPQPDAEPEGPQPDVEPEGPQPDAEPEGPQPEPRPDEPGEMPVVMRSNSGGCATAPGAPLGGWWLVGLAGVLMRRRR